MKFRIIIAVLTIAIIGLFACTVILLVRLKDNNDHINNLLEKYEKAGLKIEYLENEHAKELVKYAELINEGNQSKWEIATGTNTLAAYSMFVENCTGEEDCHEDELKTAIDKLLNEKGYVQIVETNGNELFTGVKLSLQGEFIKFKSDRSVRNGAIGIDDCGSSNPVKTGTVLKDRTVKVLEKCEAPGSQSVWAHIQYSN